MHGTHVLIQRLPKAARWNEGLAHTSNLRDRCWMQASDNIATSPLCHSKTAPSASETDAVAATIMTRHY